MLIDYNKAKEAFENFLKKYNEKDGKINLKLVHTYGVVESSEYITRDLNLSDEDIELAKVIALLHDIGRFEQAKLFSNFIDHQTLDHADYGVKILFESGLIREFIETDVFDNIILKAIKNHNKYSIESGLEQRELLHSKIIRDADKTDNFRVKATEDLKYIADGMDKNKMQNDTVSDKVYNAFMSKRAIYVKERETMLDMWVSYLAFIFDYNFNSGLKYIKEKDYINILIDRMDYKKKETKDRMENIRLFAINYINSRLK